MQNHMFMFASQSALTFQISQFLLLYIYISSKYIFECKNICPLKDFCSPSFLTSWVGVAAAAADA
jgi:hypothetical protein